MFSAEDMMKPVRKAPKPSMKPVIEERLRFDGYTKNKEFGINDSPSSIASAGIQHEGTKYAKEKGESSELQRTKKHGQAHKFKQDQRVKLVSLQNSLLRDELRNRMGTIESDYLSTMGEYFVKLDRKTSIVSIDPAEDEERGIHPETDLPDNRVEVIPEANLYKLNFLTKLYDEMTTESPQSDE